MAEIRQFPGNEPNSNEQATGIIKRLGVNDKLALRATAAVLAFGIGTFTGGYFIHDIYHRKDIRSLTEKYQFEKMLRESIQNENSYLNKLRFSAPLNNEAGISVGSIAPDFLGEDLEGKVHYSTDHSGKVLVVHRWEPWNFESRRGLVEVLSAAQNYPQTHPGVVIVTVTQDQRHNENDHVHFRDIIGNPDLKGFAPLLDTNRTFDEKYGIKEYPATIIISQNGRIAGTHIGVADYNLPGQVNDVVRKLLKK